MKLLTTGILITLIFACASARADTTWVAAGNVSGIWTAAGSPYMIFEGDITVASSTSLTIQPGVEVYFAGPFLMIVNGSMWANGSAQDSIYFTAVTVDTMEQSWRGIFVQTLELDTACAGLRYCVFEHANGRGALEDIGGALQMWGACGWVTHSSFRHNRAALTHDRLLVSRKGGAMYVYQTGVIVDSCELVENYAGPVGRGGAIFCDVGPWNPAFRACVMHYDTAGGGGAIAVRGADMYARPVFNACTITDNYAGFNGGGVHLDSCNARFEHCAIGNNLCGQCGGGAYLIDGGPYFSHCEIFGNQSFWGGGLYCYMTTPELEHCVMYQNIAGYGGALYSWQAHPSIIVSTLTQNLSTQGDGAGLFLNESVFFMSSSIVSHSLGGEGIYFLNSPQAETHNCDFAQNSGGPFGFNPDESAGPPNIGDLMDTNINGDSCDTYMNIYFDPQFMNAGGGDYHLNWNSPCIDAGFEWDDPDPDGTMPDVGAFYRDAAPATLPPAQLPREVVLEQNYPNPFNASTQIQFDLPQNGDVRLSIYDITGREVTTLVHGMLAAGPHTIHLDAAGLPSGVYIYRLQAVGVTLAKKFVLIK